MIGNTCWLYTVQSMETTLRMLHWLLHWWSNSRVSWCIMMWDGTFITGEISQHIMTRFWQRDCTKRQMEWNRWNPKPGSPSLYVYTIKHVKVCTLLGVLCFQLCLLRPSELVNGCQGGVKPLPLCDLAAGGSGIKDTRRVGNPSWQEISQSYSRSAHSS